MVNSKHWDKMKGERDLRETMERYNLQPQEVIEIIEQYISRKKLWEGTGQILSSDGRCPGQLS